jgi:hypothetical protein
VERSLHFQLRRDNVVGISIRVTPSEQAQSATISQDSGSLAKRHVTGVVPLPSSFGEL